MENFTHSQISVTLLAKRKESKDALPLNVKVHTIRKGVEPLFRLLLLPLTPFQRITIKYVMLASMPRSEARAGVILALAPSIPLRQAGLLVFGSPQVLINNSIVFGLTAQESKRRQQKRVPVIFRISGMNCSMAGEYPYEGPEAGGVQGRRQAVSIIQRL